MTKRTLISKTSSLRVHTHAAHHKQN